MRNDPELQSLLAELKVSKLAKNKNSQSLEESKRKKEIEAIEERRAKRNQLIETSINRETNVAEDSSIPSNDPYLKEGILILAELIASTG